MSTISYTERVGQRTGLPAPARRFLLQVGFVAGCAAVVASLAAGGSGSWTTFAVLLVVAIGAQATARHVSRHQVFHTGLAFTVAAAVVLQPRQLIAICIAQHLADWARNRYAWYIQGFNIANYTVCALAAWAVVHGIQSLTGERGGAWYAAAAVAAGVVFVAANHALLAQMLRLARGRSWEATGLFSLDGLLADASLAATGVTVAIALAHFPAAAVVAAFPLFLIHRALVIPELRAQALRDSKTGLLNMRGFREQAEAELTRAKRFGRPLAVIMVDLDDLRGINNDRGHLAGDAALAAVAEAIAATTRDFDLTARFGGDEFLLLLPETTRDDAETFAERLENRVARGADSGEASPMRLTISVGVASLTVVTETLDELVDHADSAMYDAKRRRSAGLAATA